MLHSGHYTAKTLLDAGKAVLNAGLDIEESRPAGYGDEFREAVKCGEIDIKLIDEAVYITVEKNLVYDCSSDCFHQHYGENNMVRNNIFAFGGEGQVLITRNEDHNSLYLYNNILVGSKSLMYETAVKKDWFIDNNNLYWDYDTVGNLVYSGENMKVGHRNSIVIMTARGYYNNAVFADPVFRDVENRDFTLAENSPALTTGFEPWEYNAGTKTLFY